MAICATKEAEDQQWVAPKGVGAIHLKVTYAEGLCMDAGEGSEKSLMMLQECSPEASSRPLPLTVLRMNTSIGHLTCLALAGGVFWREASYALLFTTFVIAITRGSDRAPRCCFSAPKPRNSRSA